MYSLQSKISDVSDNGPQKTILMFQLLYKLNNRHDYIFHTHLIFATFYKTPFSLFTDNKAERDKFLRHMLSYSFCAIL